MLQSFSDWLTSPFRGQVPLWTLLAILAAWIVIVWIVYDVLRIAAEFGEAAAS